MRRTIRGHRLAACLLLQSIPATMAFGGGLYLTEIGPTEIAVAGAGWAARAEDAATLVSNPAGLSRIAGSDLLISVQPLYADLAFSPNEQTTTTGSDGDAADWIPSASALYAREINDRWAFGVGTFGNFGLAADYGSDWVGRYYLTEITLQALALKAATAYRINDQWSVGVGLTAQYGIFEQKVAINNGPNFADGQLKIDDEEVAWQFDIGFLYEPVPGTRLGLQYVSEADLDFSTNPEFSGLRPALEAILANRGLLTSSLDVGMKIPQAVTGSLYHEINEEWEFLLNLGWQDWSEFGKVDILLASEDATSLTANRGYRDSFHVAVGARQAFAPDWKLSYGFAFDRGIVPEGEVTLDLPTDDGWRVGIGVEHRLRDGLTISGGYEMIWSGDIPVDQARGPLAGRVTGEFEDVAIHVLNVAVRWGE